MSGPGPATRALLGSIPGRRGDWPERDGREVARRLCEACVQGLDVDGAAVSVLTGTVARETLWATDTTADRLEELQFTLNEGACVQAATTGDPVLVADLGDSVDAARWPVFAASVLEQTPARALFALPLQWGVTNLGVLDLYRTTAGGLDRGQWRDALSAVDLATVLMLDIHTEPERYDGAVNGAVDGAPDGVLEGTMNGAAVGDGAHWLDPSSGNHAQVHQATGMVLVQLGVSSTEALARMRAHAYAHERLLIDVARDVVNRRLTFTDGSSAETDGDGITEQGITE